MASFSERMIGAAKLDIHTYEEVEADIGAMGQAMLVVLLSSLAHGIGSLTRGGLIGLLGGAVAALAGWFVWAFLVYVIGAKMLPTAQTHADIGQLLRTTGFSASPGLLRIFGMLPILGGLLIFATNIWMLIAMVIAVRQALDYESSGRAVLVVVIGWVAQAVVIVALMLAFGIRIDG